MREKNPPPAHAPASEGIGERIRQARRRKGLTRLELSRRCGIPNSTLQGYENGRNIPTIAQAMKIAKSLDFSLDWLSGKTGVAASIDSLALPNERPPPLPPGHSDTSSAMKRPNPNLISIPLLRHDDIPLLNYDIENFSGSGLFLCPADEFLGKPEIAGVQLDMDFGGLLPSVFQPPCTVFIDLANKEFRKDGIFAIRGEGSDVHFGHCHWKPPTLFAYTDSQPKHVLTFDHPSLPAAQEILLGRVVGVLQHFP